MKANLFLITIFATVAGLQAQVRDQPVPRPAIDGGGLVPDVGLPSGGGFPVGPPVVGPGGFPGGAPGGGGLPGIGGGMTGMGGGLPGMGGGMTGMGGMMGVFNSTPGRYNLMSMQIVPAGGQKPQPIILKLDTLTGEVWQLQAQPGQPGLRFMVIPQQGVGPHHGFGMQPGRGGVLPGRRPDVAPTEPTSRAFPVRPNRPPRQDNP